MRICKIQPPKSPCFPAGTYSGFSIWTSQAGTCLVFPEPRLLNFSNYRKNVSLPFIVSSESRSLKAWTHCPGTYQVLWSLIQHGKFGASCAADAAFFSESPFWSCTLWYCRWAEGRWAYRLILQALLPLVAITYIKEWKQSLSPQLSPSLCRGLGGDFLLPHPWERACGAGGACSPCPRRLSCCCSLHVPHRTGAAQHPPRVLLARGICPEKQRPVPCCSAWIALYHHCHLWMCR